jgi:hypothetical protein
MSGRLSRLAPLTGLVFAVLFAVVTLTEKETPEAGASGAKVIAFYAANHSNIKGSNTLLACRVAGGSCTLQPPQIRT